MGKTLTVQSEVDRLNKLFEGLPPKKLAIAEGLIVQAARLRVQLDILWADIEENGSVEDFTQSEKTEPYERERPCARLFTATDKNYQAIVYKLAEMLPAESAESFAEKLNRIKDE